MHGAREVMHVPIRFTTIRALKRRRDGYGELQKGMTFIEENGARFHVVNVSRGFRHAVSGLKNVLHTQSLIHIDINSKRKYEILTMTLGYPFLKGKK
jgi:hypothetical protein